MLALAGVVTTRTTPAAAAAAPAPAPGTIRTWAGGAGQGPAFNVSVRPGSLAARGPLVYFADSRHEAVQALDAGSNIIGLARLDRSLVEAGAEPATQRAIARWAATHGFGRYFSATTSS